MPVQISLVSRLLLGALFCSVPGAALAADMQLRPGIYENSGENFSVSLGGGVMEGKAHEFVRDPATGEHISELDWDIKHATTINAALHSETPGGLFANLSGWVAVEDSGSMTDYDWLDGQYGRNDWTHRSISPDTDFDHAWEFDANLGWNFIKQQNYTLGAMIGYRATDLKWSARGGSYIYSVDSFRDSTGDLPGGRGISYKQSYETPYLGMTASARIGRFGLKGTILGSTLVTAHGDDHHWLRDLEFHDTIDDMSMVAAKLEASYDVTRTFSIVAGFEYEEYFRGKGKTRLEQISTGYTASEQGQVAAQSLATKAVSLSARYRF
ncbi:plasminogen activator [Faunimonas pinastri]|uniref:Plasminogen activator n=1 Tax=Faunimonas pinastri TaxID=1855383 RepID=A0A1H9JBM1_9HYPH|nr:omptin family outer membrane protease [Faunimonas pinastri]SEQ84183.1 plasminogen activator [Faunimonas pinastri]